MSQLARLQLGAVSVARLGRSQSPCHSVGARSCRRCHRQAAAAAGTTESASSSSTSPKQYSSRRCSAPASPARGSRPCCRECNGLVSREPRMRLPFARQYDGIRYRNMPATDAHWIAHGSNGFMIIQCAASSLHMCAAHLARTKNHNSF